VIYEYWITIWAGHRPVPDLNRCDCMLYRYQDNQEDQKKIALFGNFRGQSHRKTGYKI
jgi:hypothetical protein